MRATTYLLTAAGVGLMAACYGGPQSPAPPPRPTVSDVTRRLEVQDSMEGVRRADADSLAAARMATDIANLARADSIEASRVAGGEASRAAAATSTRLRTELGVAIQFEFADDRIRPDAGEALARKAAILLANPTIRLQITGACDERGSAAYNHELGNRRAASVKRYLVARGIDAGRLDARSAGEGSPVDDGGDEMAWARNRRADFAIVGGSAWLSMR